MKNKVYEFAERPQVEFDAKRDDINARLPSAAKTDFILERTNVSSPTRSWIAAMTEHDQMDTEKNI